MAALVRLPNLKSQKSNKNSSTVLSVPKRFNSTQVVFGKNSNNKCFSFSNNNNSLFKSKVSCFGWENNNQFSTKRFQQLRQFCTEKKTEEREEEETFKAEEADARSEDVQTEIPVQTETTVGSGEKYEFQAETRKLLDIVACSLYSDKQVFIRELISNASDALEKLRHKQVVGDPVNDDFLPLEINIYADAKSNTLIIQDYGIGMSKNELINNLGTIARSGTSEFVKNLQQKQSSTNLIGQFGVGFYSSFMVADKVTVYSRSANVGEPGYMWSSDGFVFIIYIYYYYYYYYYFINYLTNFI